MKTPSIACSLRAATSVKLATRRQLTSISLFNAIANAEAKLIALTSNLQQLVAGKSALQTKNANLHSDAL